MAKGHDELGTTRERTAPFAMIPRCRSGSRRDSI